MANTLIVRQSSQPLKVPTTTQILLGELAINTYDGKLYLKKNDGSEQVILVNPFTEAEATAAKNFTVARILDSLTFDGVTTQFGLTYDGGTALTYGDINLDEVGRLMIVVGGQIQGEGNGFNIGTGIDIDPVQITFTEAPETGLAFFGTVQARQGNVSPGISEERAIAYSIALGGN